MIVRLKNMRAEPRILRGVDQLRFADRRDHALGRRGVEHLVVARGEQPVAKAHRFEALARIVPRENVKDVKCAHHSDSLYVLHALHT